MPQPEHVLLLANHRSATITTPPRSAALYSSCRRHSWNPISAMDRARWRFAIIPLTFKSSMPMVWNRRVRSVVSLCWASLRMLPLRAGSLASFALALRRLAEPFCLRLKLRDKRRWRLSNALCGLGPTLTSPVESAAKADTPKDYLNPCGAFQPGLLTGSNSRGPSGIDSSMGLLSAFGNPET